MENKKTAAQLLNEIESKYLYDDNITKEFKYSGILCDLYFRLRRTFLIIEDEFEKTEILIKDKECSKEKKELFTKLFKDFKNMGNKTFKNYINWKLILMEIDVKYMLSTTKNEDVENTYKNVCTKIIGDQIVIFKNDEKALINYFEKLISLNLLTK